MTDRIIVSRTALEQALRFLSGDREIARDYLREIIDTAEEAESEKECVWTWDDYHDNWNISCEDICYAHRKTHGFTHCPHCGGRIVDPPVKRLCWCGKEMVVVAHGTLKGYLVTCSANLVGQHGTGPIASTSAKAWTDYDKMVGR